jgi:hypothetical protein
MQQPTGHEAITAFETQGRLEPGTEGFWTVWGARAWDMKAGDILLSKVADTDEVEVDYIAETFKAKSPVRQGFVNQDGKRLTVGVGAPIIIVRWDTRGRLAEGI